MVAVVGRPSAGTKRTSDCDAMVIDAVSVVVRACACVCAWMGIGRRWPSAARTVWCWVLKS